MRIGALLSSSFIQCTHGARTVVSPFRYAHRGLFPRSMRPSRLRNQSARASTTGSRARGGIALFRNFRRFAATGTAYSLAGWARVMAGARAVTCHRTAEYCILCEGVREMRRAERSEWRRMLATQGFVSDLGRLLMDVVSRTSLRRL